MGKNTLLFESLFKRNVADPNVKDFLTTITKEHPYFSPAQFYLLLHTEPGTWEYDQQAAKTAVLFNNPWWLQFQLQEGEGLQRDWNDQADAEDEQPVGYASEKNDDNKAIADITVVEVPDFNDTPHQPEQTENAVEPEEDIIPNDIISHLEKVNAENTFPENNIEITSTKDLTPDQSSTKLIADHPPTLLIENGVKPTEAVQEGSVVPENNIAFNGEHSTNGHLAPDNEFTEQKTSSPDSESTQEEEYTEILPVANDEQSFGEAIALGEDAKDEDIDLPVEPEPLKFKLNINVSDTTEENISFEPLHTTDYFASQGIKISADIKPDDKLGKQLKSFTDWLKTMKKVHNEQLTQVNEAADITIRKLAENSNKEDEVVTEAMAEVLLQQGKTVKAFEVYQKLSLLNPSKSAYFAAKIDQLKEH